MATEVERMVVSLEASITKFQRTMERSVGITNNTMKRIEKRQQTAMQKINAGWSDMQRNIATAFAVAASARGVVTLIDTATRIENSLKVAGLAGEELTRVYDALYASAQKNAAPLESLAQLYGRVVLVQKELGASTEDMLRFTDNVAMALRVAGTDAQGASGALLQLSQAMGSGVVRAEEFNSILEGALPIAQAVAVGLKEAGGSVAALRQLVVDGKVSSEAFFRAFEAGAYTLEEKVGNASLTVQQQFEKLKNELVNVAREFNEGTNASELLGEGIANLAEIVRQFGDFVQAAIEPTSNLIGLFTQGTDAARSFANEIARITGADAVGAAAATWINDRQIPGLSAGSSAGGRVLTQTFEMLGKTPQDQALADALAGKVQPEPLKVTVTSDKPAPVSLSDSKAPSGKGSKSSGDRYAESIADFERRIAMLNQETELMRTLNPLINDYGYSKERLKAIQELENAAAKAGIEISGAQRSKIEELADAYALASSQAARLAEEQDRAREAADELARAGRAALDTIIDGFIEGKDAGEIFGSVLKDLGRSFLNLGLNAFGSSFGGGNLLGSLFGGFRANGGPVQAGKAYVVGEKRPELFVPNRSGAIVPSVPAADHGAGVSVGDIIIQGNADAMTVQQLRQWSRFELPSIIRQHASSSIPVNG